MTKQERVLYEALMARVDVLEAKVEELSAKAKKPAASVAHPAYVYRPTPEEAARIARGKAVAEFAKQWCPQQGGRRCSNDEVEAAYEASIKS
jgi:hypothetical protein